MDKIDHGMETTDSEAGHPASQIVEPAKPPRRPVTPLAPMTDEEHEALREIIKMIGIKREDISEERLKEICKLWE